MKPNTILHFFDLASSNLYITYTIKFQNLLKQTKQYVEFKKIVPYIEWQKIQKQFYSNPVLSWPLVFYLYLYNFSPHV